MKTKVQKQKISKSIYDWSWSLDFTHSIRVLMSLHDQYIYVMDLLLMTYQCRLFQSETKVGN